MKLAAICCTYLRPFELAQAVACFRAQDYPAELRELIVLDDAGQYDPAALDDVPGVKLVTTAHRFRTLGEKRNASAALVSPDVAAYCVWDDDDIYLPWHMSAAAKALASADYAIPSIIWTDGGGKLCRKETNGLFHGAWSFRREAFVAVGGYPWMQSGQDQGLLKRFKAATGLRRADPIHGEPRPSYAYRWFRRPGAWHLSAMGKGGYEQLAERGEREHVARVVPRLERDWVALAR